ncbi:tyrosine-type recombinase/integrase [Hoeflea sp. TYP-13]|uniref:tyrosine-type recombinase/integrase n=1 Tax=Hoeflea sp. TYP-13 TaxID=3230023 RepID=UPI0034C6D86D
MLRKISVYWGYRNPAIPLTHSSATLRFLIDLGTMMPSEYDPTPLQQRYLYICEFGRGLARMTLANYASSFRCFNRFLARYKTEPALDFDLMLKFLKYMKTVKKYGKSNMSSRIHLVKIYTLWLYENGHIEEWPFANGEIRVPKPRRSPRPLEREQIARLLEQTHSPKQWLRETGEDILSHHGLISKMLTANLAIRLMLATGMRIGEVTTIKLRNILEDGAHIRVLGKGSYKRSVFIANQDLLEDVQIYLAGRRAIRRPHPYFLLNSRSRRLTDKNVSAIIRSLRAVIGDDDGIVAHRIRHSTATFMFENGAELLAIQKLLGHAKIETTQIYTHVSEEALRRTLKTTDPLSFIEP